MEQLARLVGVQNSAINKYEKGVVTNIPIERVKKIASALEVSPRDLLGWEEEQDDDRQKLHRLIDTASDDQLKIIELLLSLPTEQIEALAALLRAKR
jgi:transcriptional regulator with XRE-family HTH domain